MASIEKYGIDTIDSIDEALEKPEYWHTPFYILVVCKQGAINTI